MIEQFNQVRDNPSPAHDNEMLILAEGRYVFETVLMLLRFSELGFERLGSTHCERLRG